MNYIIRKDVNKYRNYLKWHLVGIVNDMEVFSQWYATNKQAQYEMARYNKLINKGDK